MVDLMEETEEEMFGKEPRDFEQLGQSEEDVDQRIQLNPILAYGLFDGTKSAIPLTGRGLKEIVRTNTGLYTVVFPTALRFNDYIVLVTPDEERVVWVDNKTTGQFDITTEDNASAAADTATLNVVVLRPK